jgi:hypothetical protein
LKAHQELAPRPPSHFAPTPVPRAIDEIVLRAIAKVPEHRFEDASSFSRALWAVVARLRPVAIPSTWKPPRAPEATPLLGTATPLDSSPGSSVPTAATVRAPRFDERPTVVYRPDELAQLAGHSEPRIERVERPASRGLEGRSDSERGSVRSGRGNARDVVRSVTQSVYGTGADDERRAEARRGARSRRSL